MANDARLVRMTSLWFNCGQSLLAGLYMHASVHASLCSGEDFRQPVYQTDAV